MLSPDFAMLDYVSNSLYITRVQTKCSDMNGIGRSRLNRNVVLSWDLRVAFERNNSGKLLLLSLDFAMLNCVSNSLYISPEWRPSVPTWILLVVVDRIKMFCCRKIYVGSFNEILMVSLDVACRSIWLCSTVFLTQCITPECRSSVPTWIRSVEVDRIEMFCCREIYVWSFNEILMVSFNVVDWFRYARLCF